MGFILHLAACGNLCIIISCIIVLEIRTDRNNVPLSAFNYAFFYSLTNAPVQAWGGPAGEVLCGEGPGRPGGPQVNHEPAVCPGCQEGQWDPGVHRV